MLPVKMCIRDRSYDEQVFRTRGLDADQTEAAIKATMKMLNLIEEDVYKRQH